MSNRLSLTFGVLVASLTAVSCSQGRGGAPEGGPTYEELKAQNDFYAPRSIKVLPFTKVKSFDNDAVPDGIEASINTLDAVGDPIKAWGHFLFQLYAWNKASGDRRGEPLRTWEQDIRSDAEQKTFWDRVTNTYQFQLPWEGQPLAPQQKYILEVTYQPLGGKRLFSTYEFDFRVDRREVIEALKAQTP